MANVGNVFYQTFTNIFSRFLTFFIGTFTYVDAPHTSIAQSSNAD